MDDVDQTNDSEMETAYGTFMPDDDYFALTVFDMRDLSDSIPTAIDVTNEYQPRASKSSIQARLSVLPIFPPRAAALIKMNQTSIHQEIDLLLCNVPKQYLTFEQYQRRQIHAYIPAYELRTSDEIRTNNYYSFLLAIHTNILVKLSQQWHVDQSVLDYNLARLYKCAQENHLEFTLNDLSIVLEFFMQMDVDLFHLKTCSFRQSQPRRIKNIDGQWISEGIFTADHKSLEPRYGFTPCQRSDCSYCHNQTTASFPINKQIHRFLNQYQAILNCPVTCRTSNIIYALTCPCGHKDYVAHTDRSFADCLSYHRREIARMIRNFLLGEANVHRLGLQNKTDDNENWLYQHAARCSNTIQLFLDRHPAYWCFVPLPKDSARRASLATPPLQLLSSEQIVTTVPSDSLIARRDDRLASLLANNIPAPINDYFFSNELFHQQKLFFKYRKEQDPIHIHDTNFYRAKIVAVLPDECSADAKQFIESLFITHAECELNQDGQLIQCTNLPTYPTRGDWYNDLTGRP